jgi:hypothetical protein
MHELYLNDYEAINEWHLQFGLPIIIIEFFVFYEPFHMPQHDG